MVHIRLGPPACMGVITVHVLDFRAHLGLLDMYTCGKYAAYESDSDVDHPRSLV